MNGGGWQERGLCRQPHRDPDDWFPDRVNQSAARAVAVCRVCPVRVDCLQEVMSLPPSMAAYGVWGGTTPEDRAVPAAAGRSYSPVDCTVCGVLFTRRQPNQKVCPDIECRRTARRGYASRYERSGRRTR